MNIRRVHETIRQISQTHFRILLVYLLLSTATTVNLTAANATITVDNNNLTFVTNAGGANPAPQQINLTNSGPGGTTLTWTAEPNRPWARISPISGSTSTGTDVLTIQAIRLQPEQWTTATSTVNAPSGRWDHFAIWTGSEMIVWGGSDGTTKLSDGGRYNPVTDSWSVTTIATLNAPSARVCRSAIWTGREIVVWGGCDNDGTILGDGGRYDPTTNTWSATPIATTNAPVARCGHSLVWTGTEMIVWGGYDSSFTKLNDGGRYDPATNTWSNITMSSVNAPSPRYGQTAVWIGTEMIVWGGSNGLPLGDGGRYNPISNSWSATPLATTNAPLARDGHSAVWTGVEMIVYGGTNAGTLTDGRRYDPATNTWATLELTTTNAPAPRTFHSAVWTGNEMIVWGGSFSNTGKRYLPGIDLGPGTYNSQITVSDPDATNSPQMVTMTFVVNDPPIIQSSASVAPNPVVDTFTATVSVTASDPDSGPTTLSYTWSPISGPAAVGFSPNATSISNTSTATFSASGNYTLQVDITDGSATVVSQIVGLSVTVPVAPIVTTDPVDQSVGLGSTGTFNVVATGTPPLSYQWRKNNAPIGGATGSSYTTPVTVVTDNGAVFDVVVSNVAGTAISNAANLTVNPITTSITVITLNASSGSTTPVVEIFTLTNNSGISITVTPSAVAVWLTLSAPVTIPPGGTATVTVTADPSGLTGINNALLTLTNSTSEVNTLPMTFTITTPPSKGKKSGCAISSNFQNEIWGLLAGTLCSTFVGTRFMRRYRVR